jgi:hypothetical protein
LISVILLSLLTSFSYTVSILVPDIFSACTVLCLIILALKPVIPKVEIVSISLLFVFSICTQFSTVLVIAFLLGCLILYMLFNRLKKKQQGFQPQRVGLITSLFFGSILLSLSVNAIITGKFRISGGGHVFIMNHLIETGILQDYLDENCPGSQLKICQYKDQLVWNFMWADDSPVMKTGGWEANREEYTHIITDIICTPKYAVLLIQKAAEYTVKQMFSYKASVPEPLLAGTSAYTQILWRYPDTQREYIGSYQSAGSFKSDWTNIVQNLVIALSLILIILVFSIRSISNQIPAALRMALIILIAHNVANAFVCSNFSTIDTRFQSRLIWLLPFFTIIALSKYFEGSRLFTDHSTTTSSR